jgi:hypothetical protein
MSFEFTILEQLIKPVKKDDSGDEYFKHLFSWCQRIYQEKDRFIDVITIKIELLENDERKQILFIAQLALNLKKIIETLPKDQNDFERKFITETFNNIIHFLEDEFSIRAPFAPGGLLHEEYKQSMGQKESDKKLFQFNNPLKIFEA